ncbi:hypothetical protein ILUMI_17896 [Ignelater luminosus]|uniref:Uncharacterized protein n=1 Tax=Ignelater luminosus TaxID=2038154 RepID=A0A8K0CQ74_IGNLU|nr:hypothetical protein ILUMI_17896 [Ignelater luminosus]
MPVSTTHLHPTSVVQRARAPADLSQAKYDSSPVIDYMERPQQPLQILSNTTFNHGVFAENVPHNPAWECYIKCAPVEIEMLNSTLGEVNVQKAVDTYDYLELPLAQKCAQNNEPDLCEKSFRMLRYVHDNLGNQYP